MSSTTYACVECGHLHYLAVEKRYTVCPIEECDCGGQDATGKPIHLDLERSKRFGEPVPAAIDRLRMREQGIEHIDADGRLNVPIAKYLDPTPRRPGWHPWWSNVNLDRTPVRWIIYRRTPAQ